MAKGENIFKRKDGRWEARYVKEYDYTGKIKYGYCYGKTYREAKEKATQHKAAILNGTPIVSSRVRQKFSVYCDQWLNANKTRLKISTINKYESIFNKYIKIQLGHMDPAKFSNRTIEGFTNFLLETHHLSAKTVKDILIILQAVIKYTSKQLPGCMASIDFIFPKEEKKEIRILTSDEQNRLVSFCIKDTNRYKFAILFALMTGMRIGEICALKWSDIYIESRIIKVSTTVQRLKSNKGTSKTELVIGSPKSDHSFRLIPMNDTLVNLCLKMMPLNKNTYILSGTDQLIEPRTLQYKLKRYSEECKIENLHFHSLRHTFATRCVEAGFEIKSLSEILGHANTSITLSRYVHSSIELKKINMDKMNSVFQHSYN